jgi:hypothetical protein
MNIARNILVPLMLTGAVACSAGGHDGSITRHVRVIDDSHIAIHADGAPDAIVSADGEFRVAGAAVAVTPDQRQLVSAYFAAVVALRKDAIATGQAGLATAGVALGSVIAGLASGDTDKIDKDVDAQAAKIEAAAAMVCKDVSVVRSRQAALADRLPEFRPYALIDATGTRCGRVG